MGRMAHLNLTWFEIMSSSLAALLRGEKQELRRMIYVRAREEKELGQATTA